jgi:hypothetical protein
MFRSMNGWIRLAIVVSGLWLVGVSLWAAFSWKNPALTRSPFVDWWYTNELGELYGIKQYLSVYHRWFDWGTFCVLTIGVLAAIWLLTVGLAWAIRGILTPASARVASPPHEHAPLSNSP